MPKELKMPWCDTCRKQHYYGVEILKTEKKRGRYYPYRDSMKPEVYTFTEVTKKFLACGSIFKEEEDKEYKMSSTRFQKYGKGSHYGT